MSTKGLGLFESEPAVNREPAVSSRAPQQQNVDSAVSLAGVAIQGQADRHCSQCLAAVPRASPGDNTLFELVDYLVGYSVVNVRSWCLFRHD
jgi:hypothetical protein